MLQNITAVVLTYNSERRLEECLSSLSFCEKILVVDSKSTDKTKEIALAHNVEFMEHYPFVSFKEQYLFAFQYVTTDWIFIVESDEICSPELKTSVLNFFNNSEKAENTEFVGAYIPRSSYFFYKFLKHSDAYPDLLLRLCRKDALYINSSGIHQEFKTDEKTTRLQGNITHYPYTSFQHYVQKLSQYADFGAKEKTEKGQEFSLTKAILHSLWGFFRIYFFKRGFLDGKAGFIIATHHAFYVYMKYIRVGESPETFGLNHKIDK